MLKRKKQSKTIKYLTFGLKNYAGVNNMGHKTVKSKGTRVKKKYRLIDFFRTYVDIPAMVLRIEYDPNRSANIALICYKNGFLSYILAAEGLKEGMVLNSVDKIVGSTYPLVNIKFGSFISCMELKKKKGSKVARSAGSFCLLISQINENYYLIRFPSGLEKLIFKYNKAMIGIVSNRGHNLIKKGKAGVNIRLGKKSTVRGVAKNCVDHPNGGGRGKTSP